MKKEKKGVKFSIKAKLLGTIIPVVMAVVCLLIFVSYYISRGMLKDAAARLLMSSIGKQAVEIEDWLEKDLTAFSTTKRFIEDAGLDDAEIQKLLDSSYGYQQDFPEGMYLASADGIPVVFLNSCPKESLLKEGQYIYSGSDEREAGAFQAEYVLEALAGQDELDVVILKGEQGHSATIGRTEAAKQVLEDSGKKIHYVFEDYAQWDEEKAKHMFDIFLKTGSLPDCVICNNDNMALGVVRSCREHDIDPSSVLILGVDATADGCQAVADGDMCFTVCQSASGQGRAAIDVVEALAAGRGLADVEYAADDGLFVYVPFEPVTKENVEEYR